MDVLLLGSVLLSVVGTTALAGIEVDVRRRKLATWRNLQLSFGRDVTPEAVVSALEAIAGLPRDCAVLLDVRADHHDVSFGLQTDQATFDTLQGPLRAQLPSLRFELVKDAKAVSYRWGRLLKLTGRLGVLRDDLAAETSANLLAAFQPLADGEALLLRWIISPGRAHQVTRLQAGEPGEQEERRRLRIKNDGAVLRARALLAVQAGHPRRAEHLLGRVTAVLRSRGTAYGQLRPRPRADWFLKQALNRRVTAAG